MISFFIAEIKQLLKKRVLLYTIIIYFVFLLFMFFQKTINQSSGFYQKELLTPFYSIAYNSALICTTGNVILSILAGLIAGDCFDNNTACSTVLVVGRINFVVKKFVSYMICVLSIVIFVVFISVIEGILTNTTFADFDIFLVFKYILSSVLVCIYFGMGAFVVSFVCKKSIVGIMINLLFPYIISFFGRVFNGSEVVSDILFGNYPYYILSNSFSILAEKGDMQLTINLLCDNEKLLYSYSFIFIACFLGVLLSTFVSCKREYNV